MPHINKVAASIVLAVDAANPGMYSDQEKLDKFNVDMGVIVAERVRALVNMTVLSCGVVADEISKKANIQPAKFIGDMVAQLNGLTTADREAFEVVRQTAIKEYAAKAAADAALLAVKVDSLEQ